MTVPDDVEDLLKRAPIEVEGLLREASNLTLRVQVGDRGRAVYKPARGERPLHDFPVGSLGNREVTAYLVSRAGGWDLVPPTVLRDGPAGPGSLQWWIDQPSEALEAPGTGLLDVLPPGEVPVGWRTVLEGQSPTGDMVVVVHVDRPELVSLAVLDVVLNNADRKGAHLLLDRADRLWGVDHGLTLHLEDKLRTVLWGWAGEPVPEADLARLERLLGELGVPAWRAELAGLLSEEEVGALQDRARALLEQRQMPEPPWDRYPLPWPLW